MQALCNPSSSNRSVQLDALRAAAFIHVFLIHAFGSHLATIIRYIPIVKTFFSYSYGTYTFLILSGYLSTQSILIEVNLVGTLNLKHFYLRRILRIWPLYYAFITVVFLSFPLLGRFTSVNTVVANNPLNYYLFLANFDILTMGETLAGKNLSIAVAWTLSVLEQFYLVWPLLFFWVRPRFYWAIFLVGFTVSLGFSAHHIGNPYMLRLHTISACSSILFGGLLAYGEDRWRHAKNMVTNLPKWLITICYLVAIGYSMYSSNFYFGKYHFIINNLLHAVLIAFVILEQGYGKHSLFKLSNIPFLAAIGKYGYGFYLFHLVALFIVHVPFRLAHISYDGLLLTTVVAVMAFLLALLLSYLSYTYYESRFIRLKQRFYPSFKSAAMTKADATNTIAAVGPAPAKS